MRLSIKTLFYSIGLLTAVACSPNENLGGTDAPKGDDMASIHLPEGFNFSMYKDVQIEVTGDPAENYIDKIQVFRPGIKTKPVWASVFGNDLGDNHFVLRSVDNEVEVVLNYVGGQKKSLTLPVEGSVVKLDVSVHTYDNAAMFSAKTSCNDCKDNDDDGNAANNMGYSTCITSVTSDSGGYEVVITVTHDGCGGPNCKALSHFSVEVDNSNTFDRVSWNNPSGISGNIENSLGNNDPFDGFKLDNVSGIGGGSAGSFTMTYWIKELQDQSFLAKAGNNYDRLANFDSTDFACVLGGTPPPPPPTPDCDNDGVPDSSDEFPCDPALAYTTQTDTASFAAEDNWPWEGDFDFNDVVMPYTVKSFFSAGDELVKAKFFYKFRARGAANKNGMGFSYITDPANVTVSGYRHTESYHSHVDGIEQGSSVETSVVFEDLVWNDLVSFNTIPGWQPIIDTWDSVTVEFTVPVAKAVALTFNPFLIVDTTRSHEVHLPDYEPTFLADETKLGYGLDASDPSTGYYYKQADGTPWIINIPGEFKYPYEQIEISEAYLNFLNWAQSGGALNQDWYDNDVPSNIDATKIYPHH